MNIIKKPDFISELKTLVNKASKIDSSFQIFGSETHKYKFNPPIHTKKVIEFEQEYNLTFPNSFKRILTELGNGGAGPHYGLYSLEKLRKYNNYKPHNKSLDTYINKNLSVEK